MASQTPIVDCCYSRVCAILCYKSQIHVVSKHRVGGYWVMKPQDCGDRVSRRWRVSGLHSDSVESWLDHCEIGRGVRSYSWLGTDQQSNCTLDTSLYQMSALHSSSSFLNTNFNLLDFEIIDFPWDYQEFIKTFFKVGKFWKLNPNLILYYVFRDTNCFLQLAHF